MLIITHDCWRGQGTILMAVYEYSWVLKSDHEHASELMIAHGALLMHVHGFSWALVTTHEHISSHEHLWAWRYGPMAPTALMSAKERLWAWGHGTIKTHSALAQYLSVLMSAHKCSMGLLSAPEYSWVIFSFQVVDSEINKTSWGWTGPSSAQACTGLY